MNDLTSSLEFFINIRIQKIGFKQNYALVQHSYTQLNNKIDNIDVVFLYENTSLDLVQKRFQKAMSSTLNSKMWKLKALQTDLGLHSAVFSPAFSLINIFVPDKE